MHHFFKNHFSPIIVGLLIFISQIGYSQNDYREGYVVTNNMDTLFGYIDLKSNIQNARECNFKEKKKDQAKVFLPGDIQAYKIENSKFYVYKKFILHGEEKNVFLEFLVNGIVDLYYYKEKSNEYFLIEKNGILNILSNEKTVYTDKNNVRYEKHSNQYIGSLRLLFDDSPEIIPTLSQVEYGYKSLISVTKDYHESVCKEYECIDYSKQEFLLFILNL